MWQNFPIRGCRAAFVQHWWIGGAFLRPCGIAVHSYSPKGVVTTIRWISSGCTLVWKNELVISRWLQIWPLAQSASMSSTWGRGYESRTMLEFSTWLSFTQWGKMVESIFGTRKEGEADDELEGRIHLASSWCFSKIHQASQYFQGFE